MIQHRSLNYRVTQQEYSNITNYLKEIECIDDLGQIKCVGDLNNTFEPFEAKFKFNATNVEISKKLEKKNSNFVEVDDEVSIFSSIYVSILNI